MRVLVACEFSGVVRDAFRRRGHEAFSCDLEDVEPEGEWPNYHLYGDARWFLDHGWDLMIAHPPCTRLCNSGVRWLHEPPPGRTRRSIKAELKEGAALFSDLWNAPIPRIAVENPVMHRYAKALIRGFREQTQSVQPWQFGHGEVKRTCLWLKNLPPLTTTHIVEGREQRVHRMSPTAIGGRSKERSRFFTGIAEAMADQWGALQ